MKALKIIFILLFVSAVSFGQEEDSEFKRLKKLEKLENDSLNKLDKSRDTLSFRFGSKRYCINRSLKSSNSKFSFSVGKDVKDWNRFRGHYAGISLGFNNYFDNSSDFNFVDNDHFMSLRVEKSIEFRLNLFQTSHKITNHFGIITGLGMSVNNYRFEDGKSIRKLDGETVLDPQYLQPGISVKKSKLTLTYLDIPLLLEVNGKLAGSEWFMNAGVIGSMRIGSHTKTVYSVNPPLGDGNKNKVKNRSNFYTNKFKASLYSQLGWNDWSLYMKLDLVPLFENDRGPELFPFSSGIQLCF